MPPGDADGCGAGWQERAWRDWLTQQLGGISAPVLVLHGEQDQLVEPENARQITANIPGAEQEIVACSARLVRFLQEHAANRV